MNGPGASWPSGDGPMPDFRLVMRGRPGLASSTREVAGAIARARWLTTDMNGYSFGLRAIDLHDVAAGIINVRVGCLWVRVPV
jgi:hypothetical protein